MTQRNLLSIEQIASPALPDRNDVLSCVIASDSLQPVIARSEEQTTWQSQPFIHLQFTINHQLVIASEEQLVPIYRETKQSQPFNHLQFFRLLT